MYMENHQVMFGWIMLNVMDLKTELMIADTVLGVLTTVILNIIMFPSTVCHQMVRRLCLNISNPFFEEKKTRITSHLQFSMSYSLKASGRLGKKLGKYYVYFMIFLCIFNSGCNVSKSGFENAVDSLKFVGGKYSWFVGFFAY